MDIHIWKDPYLRQQLLNQFGDSTGNCYQFFDYTNKVFYFSDNIGQIIEELEGTSCSLEQWYQLLYEDDQNKLRLYTLDLYEKKAEIYAFHYRLQDRQKKPFWAVSKGKLFLDEHNRVMYGLGTISMEKSQRSFPADYYRAALSQVLREIHSQQQDGYLLLVDVDNLRQINLKYGREFSDGLLQRLSSTMRRLAPNNQRPYRITGSCFCELMQDVDASTVESYFQSVQKSINESLILSGGCVSILDYQVPNSELLLQYAESALEEAKTEGSNRLYFFQPEDYERQIADLELHDELGAAIKNDFAGFTLYYQPQVRSESLELSGAEALLRFNSPRHGIVSPTKFIPILEHSGLIVPVGLWMLRAALEQCRQWRKMIPAFRISVNMSYVQLRTPEIRQEVIAALRKANLPGSALTIEVTEGIELQEYDRLNSIFSAWKKEGVEISVDDFGTGFSSLGWLKELAIDEIKIDRFFVSGIHESAYNLRLLTNIIELARSNSLRVCCEGVETAADLSVLEPLAPGLYQGYYFSEPVPAEKFMKKHAIWQQKVREWLGQNTCDSSGGYIFADYPGELERAILDKTSDIIAVSDVNTYEIYYLNRPAQGAFGIKDYRGKKCYKTIWGKDAPCSFCPNAVLRHDTFYGWEKENTYCKRRFLLKDKLLDLRGRTLHLQVATDITSHEFVSQAMQERLEFANRVADYVDILSRETDWVQMVNLALATMGKFYQADRAYLFERNPEYKCHWDNTFEWCAPDVTPQKENLQMMPLKGVARWLNVFKARGAVILHNIEPLKKASPLEWKILYDQGIQRVIAVPILCDGQVAAFIGVDNPRYAIGDDSQARIMASFLMARFRRARKEWQTGSPVPELGKG